MATGKDLLSKLKEKNGNTEKETISGRDLLDKIQAKAPQTDSLNTSATSPLSTGFNNFSAFKAINDAQKSQKTQTRQTASQYMNHLKESNPDAYDYLANNNNKGSKAKQTLTGITNWYENAAKKAYDNSMSNTVGGNNPLNQMIQSGNYTAAKIVNSAANSIKTQTHKDLTEKYGMSNEEADFWENNYDVINGIIDNANADYRRKEYISKYSDEVKDAMNEYVAAQYQNELNYGSDLITSIQYGKKAEDLRAKLKAQGIDVYDNGEYQQLYEYLYQEYSNKTVDEAREDIKQTFEQYPAAIWGYNALDVATSPLQGILSALGTQIDNATKMDKSQPSNTNGAWGAMQNLSTLTQEATNEQIEKMGEQYGIDPKYGQFAYGVGSSTAKSLYQMALGGAIAGEISPAVVKGLGLTGKAAEVAPRVIQQLTTLPSFGATAYSTTLQQSLDMGLGEDQAQAYAIMSGINEMLYEELSLDKAYGNFAANALGKVSWQKAIMNILAQAGIEGSEEVFTELSNRWADAIINVDFSQHNTNVRNLVAQGYSEEEAEAIVAKQEKAQLLETFLAGAASGGITGVATTVAGRTKYNSAARSIVNDNVRNQAFAEEVRASAPEGTTAREIIDNAGNNPLTVNQVADIMESLDEYESQHGGMSTGELLVHTLERSGMNEEEAIKATNTLFEISEQDLSDALSEDEVAERLENNQPLTDDERYAIKTANDIRDRNARIFEENPAMKQAYEDLQAGRLTSPAEISGKARYIAEQERAEKFDNAVKPIRDTVQKVADTLTGKKGFVSGTTKNGNVNVLSFESVTKDGAIVNTSKGKADLYSIDFKTTPESVVLKSAAEIEDTNAANIMLTDYKGEDAQAYVAMSTQAFRMGQNGLPLSTLIDNPSEFVQNSLKELGDDRYSEHLLNMYQAGLKTRNEQEVQKVNKNKATKAEKMDVDKSDKLIDLKEVLGNYASINVLTDYTETKFNGSWTTENATLQTSSSSGNELAAIFHEMGEFSKALAPTEYKLYKDAVLSLAYEKLGTEKVDRIIKAYQDRYRTSGIESEQNKTYSDATDEFVNDFMAGIFSDEEGARQFVEHIANNDNYSASEKASIFKTFADWVNHLLDTIRDFLGKRQNLGGKTAMDLKKMGTDLTNIRQMALNAMDAAKAELNRQMSKENAQAENVSKNEEKHSVDVYGNDDVNNVVNRDGLIVSGLTYDAEGNLRLNNAEKISDAMWKKILTGINRAGYGFNNAQQLKERFGELAELGVKQGGYLLQQDQAEVFNKVFKIKPQTKTESDAERLKKIGTGAARFYGVTNDYKKAGYMTVSGSLLDFSDGQRTRVKDHREINEYLDEAGIEYGDDYSDSLITFMNLGNIRMQTYGIDISVKPTAQQKTALRAFFNSLNGEVTVDFSNEKGDSVGSAEYTERTSAARILNDIDAYFEDGTVPEGNANSLSRFYSIDVDSEGNSLSEQQIKFFEDSVIRDDDGKLMTMYHGTQDGGFTVFDIKKAKSAGHYGRGFYFSSSPLSGYGDNVYKVYLNITNPISSVNPQKTFTKEQITDYVKAVADNEDYGIDNYGYGATVGSVVKSLVSKKSDFDIIADINLTCVGDFAEAVKLFNEVNGTNYDGIVVETETVAFYPEQIKLTSNQNPTSDKDIRYSVDVLDIDGDIREVDYLTDIMNIRQHRAFMEVIDNTPKSKHLRSSDGEYIIPIENLLVYTDYDKDDIGISGIIVFNTNDATEIATATDCIMMSERGVIDYEQARRIIEGYIGEGIVDRYSNADFGYSQKFDRGTERNKSRSDTYHSKKFEERERLSGKNKRNVKKKHSVDVPDNFDAAVDEVLNQVKESETKFADTMSRMMDFTREMPKNFAYNAARSLKDMYKSDFVIKKLAERIDKAFNYMRNTGSLSAEDLEYIRETVGTYVIDYVNDVDETESEQYKQFIDAVKTFDIALNNKQIAEIRGRYETYTDFKRRMSGRLSLNKNGTPLDTIWTEICDLSNGALSYGENSNTQAIALAEYIEGITPTARILKEKSYEDATLDVALEVMRLYAKETAKKDNEQIIRDEILKRNEELAKRYKQRFNEAVVKAEAARALDIERLAKEIDNLTQEEQDALNQFGASLEVETIRQMKAQYINRYNKLRQQKNDTIARIKSDFRNYRQTLRANRAKSETIAKLRKEVTALENIIKHPKASATKHVPVRLLKSAIALLNAISDQSSNEDVYNRLTDLADTYAEQRTQKNTADGADSHNFGFDVDERIAADIEEIKELYSGGTYYDMYTPDIERILEIVRALKTQIKNANNLIIDGQITDAREVAVGAMGEVRDSRIADTRFTNAFNSYATPHLNAYREFRKLSGYTDGNMMKIFDDLDKASLKEMQIQQELGDIFNDVLEGSKNQKEIKRFISTKEQDLVDIGITDEHGKPVKVSRAMRMSIIMHTMNDSNMNHAIFGGFRVPDMSRVATNKTDAYGKYGKLYRFLDYTKYLEAYNNKDYGAMEKMVSESRKKMEALRNDLSEWEQKFLEDAMEMFHNRTGEYINDTSITLKGYTIARVDKYFPIKTDTRFIDTDFSELVQNGTVEGMGMLKERVQSRKPIMLEDITDVIQRQIKNTSKYAAYAIPVRNFNLSMKQSFRDGRGDLTTLESVIENVWSGRDIKFLKDLLVDIQSGRKNEGWKFLNTLRGNFAGAVLSLNPSVAIKQAASYPTAAATLGYAPLAMAIKDMPKGFFAQKGIKELEEINPLLWYRNQGYATQDIADAKSSDLIKKLPPTLQKIVGWTQFMDSGTVRTLEYAAKHYVDLNRKDLQKGSEEYWQAVSDIFTKTVTETQPNYDTLHKADIIRNPDSMVKMLVMFKTQPMQNYGILYDSVGELNATIKRYAKNKTDANRKALGKALEGVARSFTSQALSAATFSAMSILANLILHRWKKYRDDDDEWSWAMALSELGSGALSAFAGMFLGGSELLDIILYATGKSKFYDGISVSSLETVETFVTNSTNVYKSVDKLWKAKTTADRDEAVKNIVKYGLKLGTDIGQFFGIPAGNIKNILSSIYFYTVDAANSIQAGGVQISSQSDITDWELKKQHQMMYDAFMNNDLDAYNKLMAEVVAEGGEEAEDKIEKKILALLKADVVEGAIDDDKAVEMLMYTGMDEPNAYLKVGQWESGTTAKYGHLNDLMEEALGNMSSGNRKAVVTEIQMLVKSGTDKKNIASALKKEYGDDYKAGNNIVNLNALLRQALMAAGYTDSEATDMLKKWTK